MSEFMISTFNYFNESLTEIWKNVFGMSLNIIVKNFAQFPEIKRNSEHCNAFEMHHALESVIFFENCNEVRSRRDQEWLPQMSVTIIRLVSGQRKTYSLFDNGITSSNKQKQKFDLRVDFQQNFPQ